MGARRKGYIYSERAIAPALTAHDRFVRMLQAQPALQAELEEYVSMEALRLGRSLTSGERELAVRLVVETSPE